MRRARFDESLKFAEYRAFHGGLYPPCGVYGTFGAHSGLSIHPAKSVFDSMPLLSRRRTLAVLAIFALAAFATVFLEITGEIVCYRSGYTKVQLRKLGLRERQWVESASVGVKFSC